MGRDVELKKAQSVHVHLGSFDLPQEGRWLLFALIMKSRRQSLSKVKVCLVGVTPRRSSSVPCTSCSSPGWFDPWWTVERAVSVCVGHKEMPGQGC